MRSPSLARGLLLATALVAASAPGCVGEKKSAPVKLHGLCFSPYVAGQDPNLGSQVDEAQLRERLERIAPFTTWIRTFGSTGGLEKSGAIAHALGLKAALGAWISRDTAANEREISSLVAAAQGGEADLLVVGSEVLRRGELTEADVIGYVARVKQAVPGVPVGYADTYDVVLAHPAVIEAVDVVLANSYPYWEGLPVEQAVASIHYWHERVKAAAGGKRVILSETGWPSAGATKGAAVPSPGNAAAFLESVASWGKATGAEYFYFEAYDESWKEIREGPEGAHWGIWDEDGHLKPGMEATLLLRHTAPDGWSGAGIPGGAGTPTLELTRVPSRGSSDDLAGRAQHVDPSGYAVAVYIYVSGWWTKPTWADPLTSIRYDGTWTTDITTGGSDERATAIAAFLVPRTYGPPLMSGGGALPRELDQVAVAKVQVNR